MDRYMRSAPYNMLHICVDVLDQAHIEGRVYNPTLKEPIVFNDINELFLKVDQMYDRNGNPQSSNIKRIFTRVKSHQSSYQRHPKQYEDYEDLLKYQGEVLTFDLVVLTRHMSSWQGYYFYNGEMHEFQEILEIVKFITKLQKK